MTTYELSEQGAQKILKIIGDIEELSLGVPALKVIARLELVLQDAGWPVYRDKGFLADVRKYAERCPNCFGIYP